MQHNHLICEVSLNARESMQDQIWKQQADVTHVVDNYGGRTPIAIIARQEQAAACEAILLLTTARKDTRPPPGDVVQLLNLLNALTAARSDAQHVSVTRGATQALVALATALAPKWHAPDGTPPGDDAALSAIVRSSEVAQALAQLPAERGEAAAVAQLAHGVAMVAFYDRADSRDVASAVQSLSKALDASALHAVVRFA
jgi:hypothetical protein